MKRNGFTLIELLGVIIILALLMIIVFPSIVNSVKNSSDKTDDLTLELIYNASNLYISNHSDSFRTTNGNKYSISLKDLIDEGYLVSPITLSDGSDITNNKCVQVTYNNGFKYELKDIGNCESACTIERQVAGTYTVGDVVTCGTEQFYVIENQDTDTTTGVDMLAMYNLDVGYKGSYPDYSLIENPTGIQNSNVDGETYGVTIFGNDYFLDYDDAGSRALAVDTSYASEGRSYPYVYGNYEGNSIYPYVEAYRGTLETIGVNVIDAKLMSYEQFDNLKTNHNNPNWIYTTSYWFGSLNYPSTSGEVWNVMSSGSYVTSHPVSDGCFGVRPVITIQTSDLD